MFAFQITYTIQTINHSTMGALKVFGIALVAVIVYAYAKKNFLTSLP
jgi:hypothetical protein